MCSQLDGNHELGLNTWIILSFVLKTVVWEDEKTDGSQGGRDFSFGFKAVKSHGFKHVFFSAVQHMLCSFVDPSEETNSYIADWRKM